jgi:hypothetical protein
VAEVELSQGTNGIWHATADVGGKVHKWSTKVRDRDAAQQLAEARAKRIAAASIASKARWQKHYAQNGVPKGSKASVSLPTPPVRSEAPRASGQPDGSPSSPPRLLTSAASQKPGSGAPANAAAESDPPSTDETVRAAEINERMRRRAGIPDPEPEPEVVEPDEVIPPTRSGQADDDEDDDDFDDGDDDALEDDEDAEGEDDPEAREWLAEAITEGALTGATRIGAKIAKADRVPILGFKKVPRKPNEPDEKCTELARKGLRKKLARLLTADVKLTPGMAIAVGLGGMILSMSWGAEELDTTGSAPAAGSGPRPAPPQQPPPREEEPDGAAVGAPALSVVREGPPGAAPATGRFR